MKKIKDFFECLGEIWRDITAIEFLMRSAIARQDGEIKKFPKPPYTKGKKYVDFPKSFSIGYFSEVAKKYNRHFPDITFPQELIDLRNAMAHGVIARVGNDETDILFKLKKNKQKELEIEFSMPLEKQRIDQIRQCLREIRRHIGKKADDNQK